MANYIESVTTPGQGLVSSLNGQIQLEESQGRLTVYDPISNKPLTAVDSFGFRVFDPATGKEPARLGRMPDGSVEVVIAKPGFGIEDIYA